MRRAVIILALVTACIGPSETRTRGVVLGASAVAVGAGVIALPFFVTCQRDEGLFNNCDLAQSTVVPIGALVAVFGLVKIAVQLSTPDPIPTPAPVSPPAPAPPVPTARQHGGYGPGANALDHDRQTED